MDTATLWYVSRATGAVTLVLFTATVLLGILTHNRTGGRLSRAAVLRLHRSISMTAMAFLAVHIGTAILDGYVDINVVDIVLPFGSGFDPFWIGLGTLAVDLIIAIALTSWLRRWLPVRLWKFVHLSAYAMWPIAILHGFGNSGGDGKEWWMLAIDALCILAVVAAMSLRGRGDRHPDARARASAAQIHPREWVSR